MIRDQQKAPKCCKKPMEVKAVVTFVDHEGDTRFTYIFQCKKCGNYEEELD